jgi:glycosyltransferase involved in cell wall biosynthesis
MSGRDEKRSVLHIGKFYPPHMGGIEVHLRDLVRWQAGDWDVLVVVANDGLRTVCEQADGAKLVRLGCAGSIHSMPICPKLPFYIRRVRTDLVHMHLPNPAAAFAYVVSGCRIPLVITHHSDTMGRTNLKRLSDPFVQAAMNRASRIIVTSRRYADSSLELGKHRDKVEIIPLGIDASKFEQRNEEIIGQLQTRYGPRFVVAVGRLVPFKGFDSLIRAMLNVNSRLVLLGEGPERQRLEQTARECGVADRVTFAGRIDNSQIPNYLAASKMLVMPSISRAESFGIVQLEAMAAGIPVINTSIESGVMEISLDGVTGLTVPPGQPATLANAMNRLLCDGELRLRLGQAAKARVRAEFTIDQMVSRTLSVYSQALQRG